METQNEPTKKYYSFGEQFVFFLLPIVGFILYAQNKESNKEKALQAIYPAIAGFIGGITYSVVKMVYR